MTRRQKIQWRWFVVALCVIDGGLIPVLTHDFFENEWVN